MIRRSAYFPHPLILLAIGLCLVTLQCERLKEAPRPDWLPEGAYRDGMLWKYIAPDGQYTAYYTDGQIAETGQYRGNLRTGIWTSYAIDGHQVTSRGRYTNDLRDGTWEHYDTEGVLYLTIEYKPEPRRTFLLLEVKDYGNENGAYRRYYPDGSLEEEGYFWSGYFDGPVRRWHANGKPAMEGRYDQDNKTGTWKYYYPDGTLDHVEQYSNGKLNGVQRNYYPDGSPYHVSTFVDGQLSGPPEIFPLAR